MKVLCIFSEPPKVGTNLIPDIGEVYTVKQVVKRDGKEDRILLNEFQSYHYIGNIKQGLSSYPASWFVEL